MQCWSGCRGVMQSRVRVTMMRAMVMGGHKPGGMADTAVAGVEIAAAVDIAGMAGVVDQGSAPERAS